MNKAQKPSNESLRSTDNKERVIEDRLQRLIEGMKNAHYENCDKDYMMELVKKRIDELQQRDVSDIDKFVKKLTDRANNKEDYLDILMEGRFAIILARNKFSNIHIEYCERGPDLKADWNRSTVYFEVTRKRPNEDEWAEQSEATFILPVKTKNTIRKIQGKIPQLQSGETNIIVIWSDTVRLSEPELKEAFEHIKQENPEEYKDLGGVLLTEGGGVEMATLKQFYLFKNDSASKPLGARLAKKLGSLREKDVRKLQRDREEITAALKAQRKKQET